jgi:hypothetical protein
MKGRAVKRALKRVKAHKLEKQAQKSARDGIYIGRNL